MSVLLKPRLNADLPKNESPTHFLLKHVAMCYLKMSMGCWAVATEVWEMGGHPYGETPACAGREPRSIADAVGVGNEIVRCIEVKVSRADFLTGYCHGGDYNYILAPKGVLKPSDMPANIGLIEADMDALGWQGFDIKGLSVVKKPRRAPYVRTDPRGEWVSRIVRHICSRASAVWVYQNPWFNRGFKVEAQTGGVTP